MSLLVVLRPHFYINLTVRHLPERIFEKIYLKSEKKQNLRRLEKGKKTMFSDNIPKNSIFVFQSNVVLVESV